MKPSAKSIKSRAHAAPPLAVFILGIIGVAWFMIEHEWLEDDDRLGTEVFKLTYQFLLLVVIGGAVSLVFNSYTKKREGREKAKERAEARKLEEKELRRKFYNEFVQVNKNVKKIRRFLRANRIRVVDEAQAETMAISSSHYNEFMKELGVLQLKAESLVYDFTSIKEVFLGEDFAGNLKCIEVYLKKIVGEYEECYRLFPNKSFIDDVPHIPLNQLPKLDEFIAKYQAASLFESRFRNPSNEIYKSLLHMQLYGKPLAKAQDLPKQDL